jgi:hypothetical protein
MADSETPKRKPIVEMTSVELYALDFAAMTPADRAEFAAELKAKPGHGPLATQAQHQRYAEAHARWHTWVESHPEDADLADKAPPPAAKDPAGKPTSVWVIEASNSTKTNPKFFPKDGFTGGDWASDLADAARFATKAEAEMIAQAHSFSSPRFREIDG